jgi:pSer/pThr/pTyr-binding forkhead associated (FHA) protein
MRTVNIGRNAGNDVVLSDPFVSGKHACIVQNDDGSYSISDLGSRNGTYVNSFRITQSPLNYNDIVKLGEFVIPWQEYFSQAPNHAKVGNIIKTYSIGRSSENDIVVSDEYASSKHAFLHITDLKQAIIQDNNSSNGTYVNNRKVDTCALHPGDDVKIARTVLPWMQYLPSSPKHQVKRKKKKSNWWVILLIILGSVFTLTIAGWYMVSNSSLFNPDNDLNTSDTVPTFNNLKDLVKYAEKAVFLIETRNSSGTPIAYGTGFFVSNDGIGITNAHVLQGGSSFNIKTSDGQVYEIKDVIKTNTTYDYAIFRVEADRRFTILKISDEKPEKGQDICVLGNPQGIESTLTRGIISGFKGGTEKEIIDGKFEDGDTFIQMDVAISHGSSGSPVMNMKGEVIGIATLSFAEANCVNCNFAVNVDMLKSDLNKIIVQ